MADDVKPALTASEWAGDDRVILSTTSPKLGFWVDADISDEGIRLSVHGPKDFTLPSESRHALAALALYQQPYGFTREDVEQLRQLAIRDSRTYCLPEDHFGWRIADRIAALLPPEPTDG